MTTTALNINLSVTPKGTSVANGVNFAFSAGSGAPSGVVSADGTVDLSKAYPAGTSVTLAYQLTTKAITFTAGPLQGTYDLNFYSSPANGAKDAIWIALYGQNPGVYNGTEFVFSPNAIGPGQQSLSVLDNNNDGNTYAYCLGISLQGTTQVFRDDPRIVNHTQNK